MLFDRICRENGIKHILTAPRSPTTTGKVERWHKTLRRELLNGKAFDSIADAREQLDRWVHECNFERRHQGIGDVVPWERFRLATSEAAAPAERVDEWRIIHRVCVHEGTRTESGVTPMNMPAERFRQGAFDRDTAGRPLGP